MFIECKNHRDAFALATLLIPFATWVYAGGDVGQDDGDVALEDKVTEATIVLHVDGTATFTHHRVHTITVHMTPTTREGGGY